MMQGVVRHLIETGQLGSIVNILSMATQPMGQLVKPHQVTGLVAYLLSPESGVMIGALIDYDQRVFGAYPE